MCSLDLPAAVELEGELNFPIDQRLFAVSFYIANDSAASADYDAFVTYDMEVP